MTKLFSAPLLLVLLVAPTWAQPAGPPHKTPAPAPADAATLTLPTTVTTGVGDYVSVKASTNVKNLTWTIPDGLKQVPPEMVRPGPWVVVKANTAGIYKVEAIGSLNDVIVRASCLVIVGTPPTPGPNPPGPNPPNPPTPDPFTQAPAGLHVLIVVDPTKAAQAAQVAALRSADVVGWLNSHAGGEWRVWAPTTAGVENDAPHFAKAFTKKGADPWVAVSNGKAWYVGPLPADQASILALLNKYVPATKTTLLYRPDTLRRAA